MHRSTLKCPLRSAFLLFSKRGERNNVGHKAETFRTVFTSEGLLNFGYGGESVPKSLAAQVVNALRSGDRIKASHLLSNFGIGDHSQSPREFVSILEYCARSPDPLFVMEIWRNSEENNIHLSGQCYLLMVRSLCSGGYLEEAFNLVKFLGEHHRTNFILPLYNYFLSACMKMKNVVHINQCLELMDRQMAGKNEVTYIALLKLAVWQQNLYAVHEIWKEYVKYYNMNIIALRKFIWSFSKLKDLESAYKTLQHMVALVSKDSIFLSRDVKGKLNCPKLDIPVPLNHEMSLQTYSLNSKEHPLHSTFVDGEELKAQRALAQHFDYIDTKDRRSRAPVLNAHKVSRSVLINKVLRWSFNDLIHACAQARNSVLAEQLLLQMQNLGLEPSCHTLDGFVRAIIDEREFDDIMEVFKLMEMRDLKPYDSTLATLAVGCSRNLDLDLAETLLNQMLEGSNVHPYNAFLTACDTADQPERAVRLFAKMRELKVKPNTRTYELLFSLFGNVNAPYEEGNMFSRVEVAKRINAIEMDMMKNGIQHSQLSMMNLLRALGNEGMIRELMHYLRAAERQFSYSNASIGAEIYNTVLHSLVEAKESYMAIEIFRNMKLCGFSPDAATYNIMIDCCSNLRCFKSACALLSMMIRDGFYPQTLTYTALAKILLENDEFDEALNILDKAIFEGNQPDVVLFNTILQKACLQGRIDITELLIEKMHQERIQPDPSTCSYVFSAYIDHGLLTTAMEALQVMSMRMISEDDNYLLEKREEFEELILAEDDEAELRIMKIFKGCEETVAAALLNLRWCVMLGSSISWVPSQSPWATRLASTYGTWKRAEKQEGDFVRIRAKCAARIYGVVY